MNKGDIRKRNTDIDIIKFVSAVMIMLSHTHVFYGESAEDVPFSSAAIFNYLFFLITGYFTAKHFLKEDLSPKIADEHPAPASMKYVIKKLTMAFRYSAVCIVLYYSFSIIFKIISDRSINLYHILDYSEQGLYDLLFMRSIGYLDTEYGTLWYLSTLFFVLPVVSILLLNGKTRKYYLYIFSWSLPFVYFGIEKFRGTLAPPHRMLLAFSVLSLGVFLFMISEKLKAKKISAPARAALTALMWLIFALSVGFTRINIGNAFLYLAAFMFICLVSLSGITFRLKSNKFISFLGNDLSLTLYITHFPVYQVIVKTTHGMSTEHMMLLGFSGSFVLSIILIFVFRLIKSDRQ